MNKNDFISGKHVTESWIDRPTLMNGKPVRVLAAGTA
ncbi:hypothetical protein GGR30_004390 [Martelella radicis]|uniref:Uncharacterized protein n=1 Tax=Martelella radicis TaxID=1397476 RepID=A0A7W6PBF9_9HYPH|nr:hypothetical protein [Martelella radicis]